MVVIYEDFADDPALRERGVQARGDVGLFVARRNEYGNDARRRLLTLRVGNARPSERVPERHAEKRKREEQDDESRDEH